MSKLSLIEISNQQFDVKLVSALMDAFRLSTGEFPAALLVTREQAERYFYEAGQTMNNFKGIPIEVERKASETATILKTINSILTGMHKSNVTDVSHVYSLLESMKDKINA